MKKVLFYYWDPIDGPAGGGVTAYLKEMFPLLLKSGDMDIYYLNSGRKYDDSGQTFIREVENPVSPQIHSFEVVNCPVLSPSKQSIKNIRLCLENEEVKTLLKGFIEEQGGFDIIHFHSLEGLSVKVLELKEIYSKTLFIYTFHNYYPLCSQVNMWRNDSCSCDLKNFDLCKDCYESENYDLAVYRFRHLDIPDLKAKNIIVSKAEPDMDDSLLYKRFYEENRLYFNRYFDLMLAVSERTEDILIRNGYDAQKTKTLYVGTDIAENRVSPKYMDENRKGPVNIVYLGYARRDKGFYFFIEALEAAEKDLAKKIKVTFVARGINNETKIRINDLKAVYADVVVYNGFKDYEDLKNILSGQDLGVVPVMWEDNLPRVAIEQIALGIPIITSDLGGASELFNRDKQFVFEAGNTEDFLNRMQKIADNPKVLNSFWESVGHLTTKAEHCEALLNIYRGDK